MIGLMACSGLFLGLSIGGSGIEPCRKVNRDE
jgi:hypothetical protein